MDFVAIDFETANEKRSSPWSVALVVVEDGAIVDKQSWLIRPKDLCFRSYNTRIHGIKAEDVANEPEWPEVWGRIAPYLSERPAVAHNAGFDMSVLCNTWH